MDIFNDIKTAWQSEDVIQPNKLEEVKAAYAIFKKKHRKTIVRLYASLVLAIGLMGYCIYLQTQYPSPWTAKVGIALTMLTVCYIFWIKLRSLKTNISDDLLTNEQYLLKLQSDSEKKGITFSVKWVLAFVVAGAAIAFMSYELVENVIVSIGICCGTIAIGMLAIRLKAKPLSTVRNQRNINELASKIRQIRE